MILELTGNDKSGLLFYLVQDALERPELPDGSLEPMEPVSDEELEACGLERYQWDEYIASLSQ